MKLQFCPQKIDIRPLFWISWKRPTGFPRSHHKYGYCLIWKKRCGNIFVHMGQPYILCALSSSSRRQHDCGWSSDGERPALPALYATELLGHGVQRDPAGPHRHEHALHSAPRRHQNKGALDLPCCRIKHTETLWMVLHYLLQPFWNVRAF